MTDAHIKALSFIVFILLGIILKQKFSSKDEVNGLKKIILLLALPATIFIALLNIELHADLLWLPLFALAFNGVLFVLTPVFLTVLGINNTAIRNTSRLLIPSLAPGLSCFPFILEFLGTPFLAKAAMADLGNKFFVLFVLYLVAITWYRKNQESAPEPLKHKLKALAKVMLLEPVNIFILIALSFVGFGIHMENLPQFIQQNLERLSSIMTPLVLLFIGLAVVIKKKQIAQVFSLLMLRYGFSILLIGSIAAISPFQVQDDLLLALVFGLSACSFWPFAHISSIASKELDITEERQTFHVDFALSILALSLPLSVLFILTIFTAKSTFVQPVNSLIFGVIILSLGLLLPMYNTIKLWRKLKRDAATPQDFKDLISHLFQFQK
ncbi:permease [Formosa sp. A9]|uniref:permease n=1 Tax=Formosa sp. A9 TaxID=3442641 RepID=UPI003EB84468